MDKSLNITTKPRSYEVVTYNISQTYRYITKQASSQVLTALGGHLKAFIDKFDEVEINHNFVLSIMKTHFDTKSFRSKTEKEFLHKIEVVMKAAVVYYISLKNATTQMVPTITQQEMIKDYPDLKLEICDDSEFQYLLNFCNTMKVAMTVIYPRLNKKLLIDICAILEGSGRSYVTGGCQHLDTERRVKIYEQESGTKPIPRPYRRASNSEEAEERRKNRRLYDGESYHEASTTSTPIDLPKQDTDRVGCQNAHEIKTVDDSWHEPKTN